AVAEVNILDHTSVLQELDIEAAPLHLGGDLRRGFDHDRTDVAHGGSGVAQGRLTGDRQGFVTAGLAIKGDGDSACVETIDWIRVPGIVSPVLCAVDVPDGGGGTAIRITVTSDLKRRIQAV